MAKTALFVSLLVATSMFALSDQALATPGREQPKPVFGEHVSPSEFPQLIAMVRAELEPGGRWQYVPEKRLPALESRLAEMEALLAGHGSVDEMTVEEKMKLLNAQEHANAILTDNDGERVICERHKPINSRIGSVLCVTLAERNNMRDAGKNGVVRLQQTGRKEHVQ